MEIGDRVMTRFGPGSPGDLAAPVRRSKRSVATGHTRSGNAA